VSLDEIKKKWEKFEKEARKLRKKYADWEFIRRQPPLIREVLLYYIETGDIRRSCRFAKLNIEEFRELLRKANIPVVN